MCKYFLSLSSYDDWKNGHIFCRRLLECLSDLGIDPELFDSSDPPRRISLNIGENIAIWTHREPLAMGKTIFLTRRSAETKYEILVDWVDQVHPLVQRRGDYSSIWGTVSTDSSQIAVALWRRLCVGMNAFHGFLDTMARYKARAYRVLPNGAVEKTMGGYLVQLPGLFALNYFGSVYEKLWGQEKLLKVGAQKVGETPNAYSIERPEELADCSGRDQLYSEEERAMIRLIGPQWFHIPDDHNQPKYAPSIQEFRNALGS